MIRRNLPVGLLPYLISPPSLQFPYKFTGILLVISPFYPVHSLECVTETPVLLLLDFITSNNVSLLFYDSCSPSLLSSRLLRTFTWTTFKGLFSAPPSSSVDRAKALNSRGCGWADGVLIPLLLDLFALLFSDWSPFWVNSTIQIYAEEKRTPRMNGAGLRVTASAVSQNKCCVLLQQHVLVLPGLLSELGSVTWTWPVVVVG